MKTGDRVLLEWDEHGQRRTEATVLLASGNGKSLIVEFEAILRGHVGMCPLLQEDDGSYVSVVDGLPVRLTPIAVGEMQ